MQTTHWNLLSLVSDFGFLEAISSSGTSSVPARSITSAVSSANGSSSVFSRFLFFDAAGLEPRAEGLRLPRLAAAAPPVCRGGISKSSPAAGSFLTSVSLTRPPFDWPSLSVGGPPRSLCQSDKGVPALAEFSSRGLSLKIDGLEKLALANSLRKKSSLLGSRGAGVVLPKNGKRPRDARDGDSAVAELGPALAGSRRAGSDGEIKRGIGRFRGG
jgi:hypothetical protein